MKGFLGKIADKVREFVAIGNAPRDNVESVTERPRPGLAQARNMVLPEKRRVAGAFGRSVWPAPGAPGHAPGKLIKRFAEASVRGARGY